MHPLLKNKKLISFDGDGTLWYPRETKREIKPHNIYLEHPTDYLDHLELTPGAYEVLNALRENEAAYCSVTSTIPYERNVAKEILVDKITHLRIADLVDFIVPSPDHPKGKAEVLTTLLDSLKLSPADAVHIGDSFDFDILHVRQIGITCVLIDAPYNQKEKFVPRINELIDLL